MCTCRTWCVHARVWVGALFAELAALAMERDATPGAISSAEAAAASNQAAFTKLQQQMVALTEASQREQDEITASLKGAAVGLLVCACRGRGSVNTALLPPGRRSDYGPHRGGARNADGGDCSLVRQ